MQPRVRGMSHTAMWSAKSPTAGPPGWPNQNSLDSRKGTANFCCLWQLCQNAPAPCLSGARQTMPVQNGLLKPQASAPSLANPIAQKVPAVMHRCSWQLLPSHLEVAATNHSNTLIKKSNQLHGDQLLRSMVFTSFHNISIVERA